MARAQSIGLREALNTLLPRAEIERLARESAMVQRRRKLDPVAMLWTLALALGFGAGSERSLAGLRRTYERATGVALAAASFQRRFSPALVRFLRAVLPSSTLGGASV